MFPFLLNVTASLAAAEPTGSAAADPPSGFAHGLTLMVVGMAIVFVSLALLGAIVRILGAAMPGERAREAPAPQKPAREATTGEPAAPVEPPATIVSASPVGAELVAVLAAAASVALGARVRVKRVIELREDVRPWISGGRAEVMQSHRAVGGQGR